MDPSCYEVIEEIFFSFIYHEALPMYVYTNRSGLWPTQGKNEDSTSWTFFSVFVVCKKTLPGKFYPFRPLQSTGRLVVWGTADIWWVFTRGRAMVMTPTGRPSWISGQRSFADNIIENMRSKTPSIEINKTCTGSKWSNKHVYMWISWIYSVELVYFVNYTLCFVYFVFRT